jgi:phospholipase C
MLLRASAAGGCRAPELLRVARDATKGLPQPMSPISRRTLIGGAAVVGTGAALGVGPLRTARAQAATTGTITDVKHVVVLMQENRSFDHYFGTLQGVRGFADRATIQLPGGYSVFNQPDGSGRQYPWNLSNGSGNIFAGAETLAQCDGSLDHSWSTQHEAWATGAMDDWVSAKGSNRTMGYLTRSDIPFHYALADAYTICDAYHCSILSATGPNRTYLWSGMIDPNGTAGGPAYDGGSESGLSWQTYAETLQDAGVSWKVYQVASDNYGDNALAYFNQFTNASTSSPLYQNGMGSVPDQLGIHPGGHRRRHQERRGGNGTLPQVSWVVANQQTSEHPDAPPERTAPSSSTRCSRRSPPNEDVLDSTVLFLNYDENDGFFDHVPPPSPAGRAPPASSTTAPTIGLGFRVPMIDLSRRGRAAAGSTRRPTTTPRSSASWSTWTTALGTPALLPEHQRLAPRGLRRPDRRLRLREPGLRPAGEPAERRHRRRYSPRRLRDRCPTLTPDTNALPAQETGTRPARSRCPTSATATSTSIQTRRRTARSCSG